MIRVQASICQSFSPLRTLGGQKLRKYTSGADWVECLFVVRGCSLLLICMAEEVALTTVPNGCDTSMHIDSTLVCLTAL